MCGKLEKKHKGIGDKHCPQCEGEVWVKWQNIGDRTIFKNKRLVIVEWGRFYCLICGWQSELHHVEFDCVEAK